MIHYLHITPLCVNDTLTDRKAILYGERGRRQRKRTYVCVGGSGEVGNRPIIVNYIICSKEVRNLEEKLFTEQLTILKWKILHSSTEERRMI